MLSALRVVEGAIVTVSGVMGVEVGTERIWRRCDELGLARLVLVNLLDRERADFYTALDVAAGAALDRSASPSSSRSAPSTSSAVLSTSCTWSPTCTARTPAATTRRWTIPDDLQADWPTSTTTS